MYRHPYNRIDDLEQQVAQLTDERDEQIQLVGDVSMELARALRARETARQLAVDMEQQIAAETPRWRRNPTPLELHRRGYGVYEHRRA